jgi:hypothetical protein
LTWIKAATPRPPIMGRHPMETVMKVNVGAFDRAARMAIGFALIVYLMVTPGPYKWLGFIGIVPLLTGIFGNCPLYTLLGIRTCRAA